MGNCCGKSNVKKNQPFNAMHHIYNPTGRHEVSDRDYETPREDTPSIRQGTFFRNQRKWIKPLHTNPGLQPK